MRSQPFSARQTGYSLTGRLHAVIAFLGLLPLLGLAVALVGIHSSASDTAALDRAARGTIYLERINSLVYAAVMESRGIYMSADWAAAEPFARGLTKDLDALQPVARSWKEEAIASQQSNVEELARRIDQFVQFRTELVRVGKEESTAAARVMGDNDANRNVRSALNDSLSVLARAYEQEIGSARRKVEEDERNFIVALSALVGFALIALGGGIVLVRRGLLAPLWRVKASMLRIAQGDLDVVADARRCPAEIGEMMQAVGVFHGNLVERRQHAREARLLSELNEWLQSCNSLDELYQMISEFLARLLPHCAGSLYIYANSRDVLESAKAWNGGTTIPAMHPEDCWALRRGRVYTFGDNEIDFPCAHVGADHTDDYCCIPILAHGETVGLLHLEFGNNEAADDKTPSGEKISEQRRLGLVCAEQISLAIANVKLRDELRDQSIRDVLTGLFNRRYMLETGRREFSRAARMNQTVSLLSIDVDHFKKYNDNHGHDAGDTVLRAIGNCLATVFRNEDVPCRFGGEEFVVILPGAPHEVAMRRAEQLRAKVEALVVRYLEENLPRITISIGVAAFPEAGDNPETVLKAADAALYRAKENGRNRVEASMATNVSRGSMPEPPAVAELTLAVAALVPGETRDSSSMLLVEAADG
jgi:diguanylate cyclase (GGDEF)-like protein